MLIKLRNRYHYETPIGRICIEDDGEAIIGLYLDNMPVDNSERETELIKETYNQLNEYFEKKRIKFEIPIKLHGTEFQNKVWNALCTIPYGETCTYKDIAKKIGNIKAVRAVGGANNKNPIMIIVPCHRVIGANGSLVGFGAGVEVKRYLLTLEGFLM